MPHEAVDVLIVGAGAGGGAVAWRLAQAGLRVVCLEQGDWVDPASVPSLHEDWELARQTTHHPNPNVRRLRADYPVCAETSAIQPMMYNAVGGSTIHWGGTFPRLRPSDFRVRTLDAVADDWPLAYDELAPYYELNDRITGVAGLSGDPANPPRGPRQLPPVPLGLGGMRMAAAFDRLEWHWWPSDMAIATRPYAGRGACNNCGPCDLGCPTGARASTDVTHWPVALRHGAELRTGARVLELITDSSGRVTGAAYVAGDGVRRRQKAAAVVLAANGAGTPRLLLLSGLANSSGLVGKRLMHHPTGLVTGVFDEPLESYKGPFAASILCQQFYETDPDRGFVRGFQMQCVRSDGPLGTALGHYLGRLPWGRDHPEAFTARFGRTASLTVTCEDLPRETNTVTLDERVTDDDGIPAPRLHYEVDENSWQMLDYGIVRATEAFAAAGATGTVPQRLVAAAGFHFLGTARMGDDPETSVVDRFGRAHDVDNLFVADGSVFVTAGAVNPTSTIQALALRTADHIVATSRELTAP